MKQSTISGTMRELRKKAGYTQEEVSSKLNIQRQTYSNYENACRTPPIEALVALADLYNVSVDYLVRGGSAEERSARANMKEKLFDGFSSLSKPAQKEVLDFIRFKKIYSD